VAYRDYALNMLIQIFAGIKSGRVKGLSLSEEKYLIEVSDRLMAGDKDPFQINRKRGRPNRRFIHMQIAEEVARLYYDENMSLEDALNQAGEKFNVSGSDGGTANKAFKK